MRIVEKGPLGAIATRRWLAMLAACDICSAGGQFPAAASERGGEESSSEKRQKAKGGVRESLGPDNGAH